MPRPGPNVTSDADTQPGSDSLFPTGFSGGGALVRSGSVGTGEIADGSVASADLNLASVATALAARGEFTGTYAGLKSARMAPGLRWAFGGDSITNGSTSSNFAYSYTMQACQMVGGLIARPDSVEAGTPGWRSDQLLASMATQIATYAPEAWVILIGTNDAGQGVSADVYAGYIKQIITTAKATGAPTVLCTVPPRGSNATATNHQLIRAYNAWIRLFAPSLGCEVADVYAALVDTTSGLLTAAYDSGDGVHPNDLGHQAVAIEVGKAMRRASGRTAPYGLVTSVSAGAGGLIADPLNARATVMTNWFEQPGGTGTAPTYSFVTDTSGVLPAGRWAQMDFDGTSSGGVRRLQSPSITTGFTVGDLLLVLAHVQVEDISGSWKTDVVGVTNNSHVTVNVWNQAGSVIGGSAFANASGIPNAAGYYDIGPTAYPVVIPAGTTSMTFDLQVKLGTGKHIKVRLGCQQILNLTTLGLTNLVSSGAVMLNA